LHQQLGPNGALGPNGRMPELETITQRKRGFFNAPWFAFLISVA
jgi:hypothetical protein